MLACPARTADAPEVVDWLVPAEVVDEPLVPLLPEEELLVAPVREVASPGRFTVACAARAAKVSTVLFDDATALMANTIPAWQCFAWLQ